MNQLTTNEDYMVPMELSYLLLPFILRSVCKWRVNKTFRMERSTYFSVRTNIIYAPMDRISLFG